MLDTLDTNVKGLLTELRVQQAFISHGFGVSVPLNPSARYDMIVDAFGGLFKVQVKTASPDSDCSFKIYTQSVHKINGKWDHKKYDESEVDLFATVYDNHVYVIPQSVVENRSQLTLRTSETLNGQVSNVHFAKDYELDNVINNWNKLSDNSKQYPMLE